MRRCVKRTLASGLVLLTIFFGCQRQQQSGVEGEPNDDDKAVSQTVKLTDAEVENLVRRSYQYVALFNTLNNGGS